jgi:hypothetical protein
MMSDSLMMVTAVTVIIIIIIVVVVVAALTLTQLFLLNPLLQMDFCVSFLLVRSCEFSATCVTREWFFACMCTDVCREMIRT